MGRCIRPNPCLWGLIANLCFVPVRPATAQTLTTLVPFLDSPFAGPILAGDTLYGVTSSKIFSVNTSGTNFKTLNTFALSSYGGQPKSRLTLVGNTLYGTLPTTFGQPGIGLLFSIDTGGGFLNPVYPFGDFMGDGGYPDGPLAASVDPLNGTPILYGTAQTQGGYGYGTLWAFDDTVWGI